MSDFMKKFWRERLGVGPGDVIILNYKEQKCWITDIHANSNGLVMDYESFDRIEHGTLFDIFNLINWTKTNLYNEQGQILGKCKRNGLEDPTIHAYEPIFTPKRHKLKMYKVRIPGLDSVIIKYTPKEFEERFEIIEQFSEGEAQ